MGGICERLCKAKTAARRNKLQYRDSLCLARVEMRKFLDKDIAMVLRQRIRTRQLRTRFTKHVLYQIIALDHGYCIRKPARKNVHRLPGHQIIEASDKRSR